jgi:signal transduction histidine kinase
VRIEQIWADGKLLEPGRAGIGANSSNSWNLLPRGMRRLEFSYTALSFVAPERIRFKHRLQGFDSDWTEAGNSRSVSYAKLPAGHYSFQVIASNNDGLWNETGASFAFRIPAPFWQTWWFLAFAGLVSTGLLGAAVRVVSVRQLRRKLKRLQEAHAIEKERMRIAKDMHDEIGGKLSRISFLSDMARRQLTNAPQASEQIGEVSEATHDILRTVDEIVWAVNPRNDTLESLTHYICRHAEDFFELTPIELELELPRDFPPHQLSADIRHNLFCAVKEALNNVLKHAQASKVRVLFLVTPRSFTVTVIDNGRGFPSQQWDSPVSSLQANERAGGTAGEAQKLTTSEGEKPPAGPFRASTNGLINMMERLESIRGSCVLKSRLGEGTQAIFTISLKDS